MEFFTGMLAIAAISIFLVYFFNINPAAAPLGAMAASVLVIVLFGVADLLSLGFGAFYLMAAGGLAAVLLIKRPSPGELCRRMLQPGFVFFLLASVAFFLLLQHINPGFRYWDEYSFWGTAAKTMHMERQLHTLVDTSMTRSAYLPGLPTVGVLFQYFTPEFSEWKVYLGYDLLMMAAMSALFGANRWRNIGANLAAAAFSLLALYGFYHGSEGFIFYANAYADFPLGVMFGGALLCWFLPENKGRGEFISAALALVMLTGTKDMGFALGLVAAGIITVDIWLSGRWPFMVSAKGRGAKAARALLVPAVLMGVVVLVYQGWLLHFTAVTGVASGEIGYEYSVFQMIKGQDPYFNEMLRQMFEALPVRQIICFGPMTTMIVVLTLVPVVSGLVTRKLKKALRGAALGLLLCAGFFAFYLFYTYLYAAVFSHSYSLTSYGRYMSSYAVGWLMAAAGAALGELGNCGVRHLERAFGTAAIAAYIASIFYFTPVHPDQYLLTSSKIWGRTQKMELAQVIEEDYQRFGQNLTVEDRIYFICQDSDGGEWFMFNYEFLPAYTVSTFGGGNLVGELGGEDASIYDVVATPESFCAYLIEQQVDYLYVIKSNEFLQAEFGPLFTDYLTSFYDGGTHLYSVSPGEGGLLTFSPISRLDQLPQQG